MSARRERWVVAALLLLSTFVYARLQLAHLFEGGRIGNDYGYFLPRLLAGAYWFERSGPLQIPWFTPAFAGGMPYFAHPAIGWFSLPQGLTILGGPLFALRWTLISSAVLGACGTYLLLRRRLRCSRWAALLGAILFQWNSFLVARFMIGHLPFHAAALVPLAAYGLVARRTDAGGLFAALRSAVLPALVLAYQFQAGDFYGIPASCVALMAIAAIDHLRNGPNPGLVTRTGWVAGIAFLLCAAKLSGAAAFARNFPRDDYPLPGFDGPLNAIVSLARCCFFIAPENGIDAHLVNRRFTHRQWEFEFGVSCVPLILLLAAALTLRHERGWFARRAWPLAILLAALVLPLAFNVYEPGWNRVLKSLPGIQSTSSLTRWLVAYVPILCVAAGLCFDRTVRVPRLRPLVALLLCAVAVGQHAMLAHEALATRTYDPSVVEAASATLRAGGGVVPIRRVDGPLERDGAQPQVPLLDDRLAEGISQIHVFDPAFGYGYERYPRGTLHPGDPRELTAGEFNFKHPATYLFPAEQGRAPGGHFRKSEDAQLAAFLDYRPFPYRSNVPHVWACAASTFAVIALVVLALLVPLFAHKESLHVHH